MDSLIIKGRSSRLRYFTWTNVAVQLTFPLVVAFTPTIVSASQETEHKVAGVVSQASSLLAKSSEPDVASSSARSMVTNEVNGQLQQWLGRFGTARIQLETDNNFSLKNSQFDLLVPLYDDGDHLFFTQESFHRTDDRNQLNIGLGMRWFNDSWMLGSNTFFDRDLTGNHSRAGIGLEYWRDYLKLSANSYMRMTNWKDSHHVRDYEARPANGWDLNAQGWLPALPQLGGKLIYEKYYGKEVALFGRDRRQIDPYAITYELNYTPVPLITFSAQQRQGASGNNDTRFGLEMNYRLGAPWRQQVDPSSVESMRSLMGSRYDLVERNNNIVLEYRKKELISLNMLSQFEGFEGETKSLNVSVTSAHGLSHIEWSAPELLAAGGNIVQTGGDHSVVLPPYQASLKDANTYTIRGVAVDSKGNRSQPGQAMVTVKQVVVHENQATLTPPVSTLLADGSSTQTLTLFITDAQNQPVDIDDADIQINTNQLKSATVSRAVKKGVGVYEITVTAGTDDEFVNVTPLVKGASSTSARVNIVAALPSLANSSISLDKNVLEVGESFIVTIDIRDDQGNAIVDFWSLNPQVTIPNAEPKYSQGGWDYDVNGKFVRPYIAKTVGTDLKATVKLSGLNDNIQSNAYTISSGNVSITSVSVGSHKFGATDGFPTTGYDQAKFELNLSSGSPADYDWTSSASWVSVSEGKVQFTGEGDGNTVTITGTPKQKGADVVYTFTLSGWYDRTTRGRMNWNDANAACNASPGHRLPTVQQWNGSIAHSNGVRGTIGGVWSEWGINANTGRGAWSADATTTSNKHYVVMSGTGGVQERRDDIESDFICRKAL